MRHLGPLILLLSLTLALPARAEGSVRSLGYTASWIPGTRLGGLSGIGLSYRQIAPSGWGWRVGAGVGTSFGTPAEPGSGWLYDLGLMATRTIANLDWGRLYGLAGAAVYRFDPARPADWTYGAGLGFEVGPRDGLSLALDIPLACVPSTSQALPAPALSLYYNWAGPTEGPETPAGVGLPQFARQGLGFSAGAGGLGAAYRAWLENGWGGAVTGIAFGSPGSYFASAGASVNRLLIEAGTSRLYATAAGCTFRMFDYPTNLLGAGVGIEYGLARGANLHVELLQTLYLNDGTIAPVPSAGLTFYY